MSANHTNNKVVDYSLFLNYDNLLSLYFNQQVSKILLKIFTSRSLFQNLIRKADVTFQVHKGSRTKSPRTNPPDKIPQTKSPWTKSPLGQNLPRQNPPRQNPPVISPQTVPLLNTFCFIEMLFSKASFLPPLLDVIYSMVMKWRSVAERSR